MLPYKTAIAQLRTLLVALSLAFSLQSVNIGGGEAVMEIGNRGRNKLR